MIQRLTDFVKKTIRLLSDYRTYLMYRNHFKRYLKINGIDTKKAPGEKEYKRIWQQLSSRVEPYSYRLFRHYCGNDPYIIPENIGLTIIEPILNPIQYRPVYTDKNMFPIIVGKDYLPKTVVCRVNGGRILNGDYDEISDDEIWRLINNHDGLVIKPSVDGSSGRGVVKFAKQDNKNYIPSLSLDYLRNFGDNFCLQEAIKQSSFMDGFCKTAVNTIRLVTYRSVKDGKVKLTAAVLRIGKEGSSVDNIHSGGKYVGVDINTGQLGHALYTADGQSTEIWNNVDFKNNTFTIPNWDEIVKFSISVGEKILHHRLLALDVALDENNQPKLIEYNIGGFSYWLFMFTNQKVFGDETQDVIDYCKKRK